MTTSTLLNLVASSNEPAYDYVLTNKDFVAGAPIEPSVYLINAATGIASLNGVASSLGGASTFNLVPAAESVGTFVAGSGNETLNVEGTDDVTVLVTPNSGNLTINTVSSGGYNQGLLNAGFTLELQEPGSASTLIPVSQAPTASQKFTAETQALLLSMLGRI